MRILDTTFEVFKKFHQNRSKSGISSRLLLRGGGGFDPPKFCPDSDWGWCFDPPPNFEPRFFIQIMLKTKVLRWILYPYSSYFLAIFKVLEKSNRISQNFLLLYSYLIFYYYFTTYDFTKNLRNNEEYRYRIHRRTLVFSIICVKNFGSKYFGGWVKTLTTSESGHFLVLNPPSSNRDELTWFWRKFFKS